MSAPTVTMPLTDWDALIARVRPFASPDRTFPLLRHVRLYESGGRLYAEATDRYRLAIAVGPEPKDDRTVTAGFDILIGVESLDDLARVTKVPRGFRGMQTITLTDADDHYTVTVSALPGLGDIVVNIPTLEVGGTWPDFTKLTVAALDAKPATGPVAFDPKFLATYASIRRGAEAVIIEPHADNKPATVRMGDDFLSLLVPYRAGSHETVVPSLDLLFSRYLPKPATAEAVAS